VRIFGYNSRFAVENWKSPKLSVSWLTKRAIENCNCLHYGACVNPGSVKIERFSTIPFARNPLTNLWINWFKPLLSSAQYAKELAASRAEDTPQLVQASGSPCISRLYPRWSTSSPCACLPLFILYSSANPFARAATVNPRTRGCARVYRGACVLCCIWVHAYFYCAVQRMLSARWLHWHWHAWLSLHVRIYTLATSATHTLYSSPAHPLLCLLYQAAASKEGLSLWPALSIFNLRVFIKD